jgi:hypothetical protein
MTHRGPLTHVALGPEGRRDLAARFAKLVRRGVAPTDCDQWVGNWHKKAWPRVWDRRSKRWLSAARAALVLSGRTIPEGLAVHRHCGTAGCVNPAHLSLEAPRRSRRTRSKYVAGVTALLTSAWAAKGAT